MMKFDEFEKMGDPAIWTGDLFDNLVALRNVLAAGTDDVILAGYAEACVSVLLKHLDMVGVCKTRLEEVITTKLLLDVSTVAKLFSTDPKLKDCSAQSPGAAEGWGALVSG